MMSKIAPSEPVGVTALRSVADIIHVMLSHHACPSQLLLEFRPPPWSLQTTSRKEEPSEWRSLGLRWIQGAKHAP